MCLESLSEQEVLESAEAMLEQQDGEERDHYELRESQYSWKDLQALEVEVPTASRVRLPERMASQMLESVASLRWLPDTTTSGAGGPSDLDCAEIELTGPLTVPGGAPGGAAQAPGEARARWAHLSDQSHGDYLLIGSDSEPPDDAVVGTALGCLVAQPDFDGARLGAHGALIRRAALDRFLAGAPPPESTPEEARSAGRELVGLARAVWQARDLLGQITLRDIRIRYKQAVMGFAWAVLMPALIVGAGMVIRYAMAHLSGGALQTETIVGMAVKSLPWAFFVGAVGFATASLTGNIELVSKVAFPRVVLPLSAALVQSFDLAIGALAVILVVPLAGVDLGIQALWALPLLVLAFVLTTGACIFLSCANLFFRDVKYIVQVTLTFGIFFAPVFFEPQMLGSRAGTLLMVLNPLSPILEGLRLSVVEGHNLAVALHGIDSQGQTMLLWSPLYLLGSAAFSVLVLLGSALLFRRVEHLFAEYI
jgi:ABC-type polysaccharide/polyol phosphate export permease